MENCKNKYTYPENTEKTFKDIESFCILLRNNKVKESKEAFTKLPLQIQCLFLHYGWEILSKKSKYSEDSYRSAFYLFKLFRGIDMKKLDIYSKYGKLKTLENFYKSAVNYNKKSPGIRSKKYDKQYQKYDSPTDEMDPLYIYYTSLYKQKPNSKLAIVWLTEHGIYDGSDRDNLIKIYKNVIKK